MTSSMNTSMAAVVVRKPGAVESLELARLPVPSPAADEVLIRVRYAGINFADVYLRRGQFWPGVATVPGMEVAGVVEGLGAEVDGLRVGDRVTAFCQLGGYAEFVTVPAVKVMRVADSVDLIDAAGFPTVGPAAWLQLSEAARIAPGESLLVHAASGALGTALVQVAHHLGAGTTIGVVSSLAKADYARSQGYETVFLRDDWQQELAVRGLHGRIDVAVESVGGDVLRRTIDAVRPLGRVVVCGNASWEETVELSSLDLWARNRIVVGFNIGGLAETAPDRWRSAASAALGLLEQGVLKVPVEDIVPLRRVADAHRALERRRHLGKTVLAVDG